MAGEAIQALGGVGYTNEFPAGRLWRDAKLYEIGAGTSEIRRMLIGRELFARRCDEYEEPQFGAGSCPRSGREGAKRRPQPDRRRHQRDPPHADRA